MAEKPGPTHFCRMRGIMRAATPGRDTRSKLATLSLFGSAFVLAFLELSSTPLPEITHLVWSPVWVALFPLVLPSSSRRALVNALVGASMSPVALFTLGYLGRVELPPSASLMPLFAPVYAAAVVAYFVSRTLSGIGARADSVEKLGMYELEQPIAQGGMGEVWRARHQLLSRPAAIKLIRLHGDDGEKRPVDRVAIQRFEREAQVTASLRSPHTVQLYDFGVTRTGSFYYVMELLEGTDLENLVKQHGPLEPSLVVHILRQTLDSLAEAHANGLIHRDIKPANLHLSERGFEKHFVKVLDFGLVKSESDTPTVQGANLSITQGDRITGTPAYLAPELATGRGKIDGRADLYALGCVAYFLLTGKLVFEGATAMQVALAHAVEPPALPSVRSGRPLPRDLERIVMQCLEKDPEKRPRSALELMKLLEQVDLHVSSPEAYSVPKASRPGSVLN
ncbi:MAG TPA: serine/threonine-protein kinase [Polyangiaceae bacterium]